MGVRVDANLTSVVMICFLFFLGMGARNVPTRPLHMRLPAARDAWHSRAATAAPLAADSSMKLSWLQRPRIHPGQTRPRVRYERRRDRDCHAAPVATLTAVPNQVCEQRNFADPAPRPRRCAGRAALRRWPLGSNRPRICLPWATSWRWQPAPLTGAGDLMRIALLRPARDRDRGRFATATAASCVAGTMRVCASATSASESGGE